MRYAGLVLLVALGTSPTELAAQEKPQTKEVRDMARTLATRGYALLQEGKVDDAIELLERASSIYRAPTISLYLARAYAQKGALVRARNVYREIAAEDLGKQPPKEFTSAQSTAVEEEKALAPQIPTLELALQPGFVDPIEVTIDGSVVAAGKVEVDPGEHRVVAVGADGRRDIKVVTVARGQALRVELRAPRVDTPPAQEESGLSPVAIGGITLLAVGGAGLIAGAVTGGLAVDRADEFNELCPADPCSVASRPVYEEADRLATGSTIAFVVGGGLAAVGAALLIGDLATSDSESPKVAVGFGSLTIGGSFE